MINRKKGITIVELVFAMFILAIAVVSVAYVFADAVSDIFHSRILTQGAFLAQSVMEVSLLAEPQPVADNTTEAEAIDFEPYIGFSYRIHVSQYATDRSFYQIDVEVFNEHFSKGGQAIATCSTLRKIASRSTQQADAGGQALAKNDGNIRSMLSDRLREEECLQCSR